MTFSVRTLVVLGVAALLWTGCQPSAPEPPSYQVVKTWGTQGDAPGEFRHPVGNNRIQVFAPES